MMLYYGQNILGIILNEYVIYLMLFREHTIQEIR